MSPPLGSGRSSFATQITVFRKSVFVARIAIATLAARGREPVGQIRRSISVAKLLIYCNRSTRWLPGVARGCRRQLGHKSANKQYTKTSQKSLSHFHLR